MQQNYNLGQLNSLRDEGRRYVEDIYEQSLLQKIGFISNLRNATIR